MAYESKPGDAVAWPKKSGDSERAPDYSGDIVAHRDIKAGERVRLALWWKGNREPKFLTGKVSDLRATEPAAAADAPGPSSLGDDLDGIPF